MALAYRYDSGTLQGNYRVVVKDSSTKATVSTFIGATADQDLLRMSAVSDLNNNGSDELTFLTRSKASAAVALKIIDPKTKKVIKTITNP